MSIVVDRSREPWAVFAATTTTVVVLQRDYVWAEVPSFCPYGRYVLNSDTAAGFKAYDVHRRTKKRQRGKA